VKSIAKAVYSVPQLTHLWLSLENWRPNNEDCVKHLGRAVRSSQHLDDVHIIVGFTHIRYKDAAFSLSVVDSDAEMTVTDLATLVTHFATTLRLSIKIHKHTMMSDSSLAIICGSVAKMVYLTHVTMYLG
jgi:hypothetical protein